MFVCLYLTLPLSLLTPECESAFRHSDTVYVAHTLMLKSLRTQDKRCCCGQPAAVIRLLSHTHNKCWDVSVKKCDWRWFFKDRERKKRDKGGEMDVWRRRENEEKGGGGQKEKDWNSPFSFC